MIRDIDAELEEIRDAFYKVTNLDLENLTTGEIRGLLELLPKTLVYLHARYDMMIIYDEED